MNPSTHPSAFVKKLLLLATATALSVPAHSFLLLTIHFITYKTVSDLLAKKSEQLAHIEQMAEQ